jgi:hypothetical protein
MTRPGSMLKSQIPVRTWSGWSETEPGYCELDLVHHCDNDTYGEYIHTLTVTDVVLGWTELQALKNRSEGTVASGVDSVRLRLPYVLKGLDSDCGGEFINQILFRYCQDKRIVFTRARPAIKNDQCRVEQKNAQGTRISHYSRLGDDRRSCGNIVGSSRRHFVCRLWFRFRLSSPSRLLAT